MAGQSIETEAIFYSTGLKIRENEKKKKDKCNWLPDTILCLEDPLA